jgi:hypothetical protein
MLLEESSFSSPECESLEREILLFIHEQVFSLGQTILNKRKLCTAQKSLIIYSLEENGMI